MRAWDSGVARQELLARSCSPVTGLGVWGVGGSTGWVGVRWSGVFAADERESCDMIQEQEVRREGGKTRF